MSLLPLLLLLLHSLLLLLLLAMWWFQWGSSLPCLHSTSPGLPAFGEACMCKCVQLRSLLVRHAEFSASARNQC